METLLLDKTTACEDGFFRFNSQMRRRDGFVLGSIGTDFDSVADKYRAAGLVQSLKAIIDVIADDDDAVRKTGAKPFTHFQNKFCKPAPFGSHVVLPVMRVDDFRSRQAEKRDK